MQVGTQQVVGGHQNVLYAFSSGQAADSQGSQRPASLLHGFCLDDTLPATYDWKMHQAADATVAKALDVVLGTPAHKHVRIECASGRQHRWTCWIICALIHGTKII